MRGKTILCLNPIHSKSMRGPTLLESNLRYGVLMAFALSQR